VLRANTSGVPRKRNQIEKPSIMGQALSLPFKIIKSTTSFYGGLFHYLWGAGRRSPYLTGSASTFPYLRAAASDTQKQALFKQHARVHLFSLASAFYLYDKPHYRKGSYKTDLLDNLRNVAIPGTGVPLSLFVRNKFIALSFILTQYPAISLAAALHRWVKSGFKASISEEYATRLLAPDDWFSYWRLNCNVVGLHSLLNDVPHGYAMENKWDFLLEGEQKGVPISPYLKTPALVIKHKNEEGGMGIFFYKNATEGGDWIIQERIQNSDWVSSLLPKNPPLSTFRVITQSRASLDISKEPQPGDVTALSCVFRAGRMNAATDHSSILFDVDVNTGTILGGTTNSHWYRLGLHEALPGRCPWRSSHAYSRHPDDLEVVVSGKVVPDIKGILALVQDSHLKLCPDVPFAGFDVVLSADPKVPICLLEVNLSCNFFRGSFDKKTYLDFIDDSFAVLQTARLAADQQGKKFKQK